MCFFFIFGKLFVVQVQFQICQLFINLCLYPRIQVKCLCLLLTQRKRKTAGGRGQVVPEIVFADSIFTHQTELFPVSTWPNCLSLSLTTPLFVFYRFPSPPEVIFPAFIVVNFNRIC